MQPTHAHCYTSTCTPNFLQLNNYRVSIANCFGLLETIAYIYITYCIHTLNTFAVLSPGILDRHRIVLKTKMSMSLRHNNNNNKIPFIAVATMMRPNFRVYLEHQTVIINAGSVMLVFWKNIVWKWKWGLRLRIMIYIFICKKHIHYYRSSGILQNQYNRTMQLFDYVEEWRQYTMDRHFVVETSTDNKYRTITQMYFS